MVDKKAECKKCKEVFYFYDDETISRNMKVINKDEICIKSKRSNFVCGNCGHRHFKINEVKENDE